MQLLVLQGPPNSWSCLSGSDPGWSRSHLRPSQTTAGEIGHTCTHGTDTSMRSVRSTAVHYTHRLTTVGIQLHSNWMPWETSTLTTGFMVSLPGLVVNYVVLLYTGFTRSHHTVQTVRRCLCAKATVNWRRGTPFKTHDMFLTWHVGQSVVHMTGLHVRGNVQMNGKHSVQIGNTM